MIKQYESHNYEAKYLGLAQRGKGFEFSLDHHIYSAVPGKIDRKIYETLVRLGQDKGTWVVRANVEELGKFHPWDLKYTMEALRRLTKYKVILPIGHPHDSTLFIVPILAELVKHPHGLIEGADALPRLGRPKKKTEGIKSKPCGGLCV